MKTLKEMIAVMQAANEGKEIECISLNESNDRYNIVTGPVWNWHDFDYRIKPDKPEYVPYETADEFIDDQQKHGIYFMYKSKNESDKSYYLPSCISTNKNNIGVCGEGYYLPFKTLLKDYVWMDGTPMGKLK